MTLGRQLRILLGVVIAAQIATALAGISLLDRMSPAIGHILEENVASVEAVEIMLAVLVEPTPSPTARSQFLDALAAAEGNVTEAEESPHLRTVREHADRALDGDATARRDVVRALAALGAVNRRAMERADLEARRLGSAGRWAVAFLTLAGLAVIVISARRTHAKLLAPLAELEAVVAGHRAGDPHRRCRPLPESELGEVLVAVNAFIDGAGRGAAEPRRATVRLREALVSLLDARAAPTVLLDEQGNVLATGKAALDLMAARGDAILAAARAGEPDDAIVSTTAASSGLLLVELRA